ncbi:dTDP-glucose 4,6-dehydratase [Anaerosporomusa subterranea]|uniref:dTDP-glucose 4,6-dehydratase n=1 Tax=Anaerosporomusa subterranea TaxID=1794912 RepID=A0A154BR63_ANASB|nr:dTDP-glucose 4,6-dehydratase [Anaerosporomusa subterranea]KYZ76432.1 dTDP-glucose 4,6-dehydratase [Anaerosporomusa subterranea]
MRKVLVTGGAGFIGSNYIYYIFNKYHGDIQVINIDKLTYAGNLDNLRKLDSQYIDNKNYVFEKVDICDEQAIKRIFETYKPEYVVNFAAESHVDRSISDPQLFLKTNILGTQILLNASLQFGVTRFHQVSTDEVYGSLGAAGLFTEQTPLDPRSPYSASKASADMICKAYYDTYKLPVTISRCSNNYGAYQFPEKLIPLMINNILTNKLLPIYGDGKQVRDWLHVVDHCEAIEQIIMRGKPGEIYNIGGNNESTNIAIVKLLIDSISEILSSDDLRKQHVSYNLITHIEDRKGHDRRYAIDASKMRRDFGWEPSIKFQDGIKDTIVWYLNNADWLENIITGDYQLYYDKFYAGKLSS